MINDAPDQNEIISLTTISGQIAGRICHTSYRRGALQSAIGRGAHEPRNEVYERASDGEAWTSILESTKGDSRTMFESHGPATPIVQSSRRPTCIWLVWWQSKGSATGLEPVPGGVDGDRQYSYMRTDWSCVGKPAVCLAREHLRCVSTVVRGLATTK
jgi:hypothetical protein